MEREQIYFIQAYTTGLIKIGYTKSIVDRFKSLQDGTSEFLTLLLHGDGTRETERDLHKEFSEFREHGEWFRPEPRLLASIEHVKSLMGEEKVRNGDAFKAVHLLMWQIEKGMSIPPGEHYGATVDQHGA